jgi:hypothetical protein
MEKTTNPFVTTSSDAAEEPENRDVINELFQFSK